MFNISYVNDLYIFYIILTCFKALSLIINIKVLIHFLVFCNSHLAEKNAHSGNAWHKRLLEVWIFWFNMKRTGFCVSEVLVYARFKSQTWITLICYLIHDNIVVQLYMYLVPHCNSLVKSLPCSWHLYQEIKMHISGARTMARGTPDLSGRPDTVTSIGTEPAGEFTSLIDWRVPFTSIL